MKGSAERLHNFDDHLAGQDIIPANENALPSVKFNEGRISTVGGKMYQEITITDENRVAIGDLTLEIQNDGSVACLADIKLKDNYKGRGYGKATYTKLAADLESRGIKLVSGDELSRQAVSIWEWLVERGLARKTSEGHRDRTKQNLAYSTEKYEML